MHRYALRVFALRYLSMCEPSAFGMECVVISYGYGDSSVVAANREFPSVLAQPRLCLSSLFGSFYLFLMLSLYLLPVSPSLIFSLFLTSSLHFALIDVYEPRLECIKSGLRAYRPFEATLWLNSNHLAATENRISMAMCQHPRLASKRDSRPISTYCSVHVHQGVVICIHSAYGVAIFCVRSLRSVLHSRCGQHEAISVHRECAACINLNATMWY